MFRSVIRMHTDMMLNPFFEPYERPEDEFECFDDEENGEITGNQTYIDILKKKLDEIALFNDKYL